MLVIAAVLFNLSVLAALEAVVFVSNQWWFTITTLLSG